MKRFIGILIVLGVGLVAGYLVLCGDGPGDTREGGGRPTDVHGRLSPIEIANGSTVREQSVGASSEGGASGAIGSSSLVERIQEIEFFKERPRYDAATDPLLSDVPLSQLRRIIVDGGFAEEDVTTVLLELDEADPTRMWVILGMGFVPDLSDQGASFLSGMVNLEEIDQSAADDGALSGLMATHALSLAGKGQELVQVALTSLDDHIVNHDVRNVRSEYGRHLAIIALLGARAESSLHLPVLEQVARSPVREELLRSVWSSIGYDTTGRGLLAVETALQSGLPGASLGLRRMRDPGAVDKLTAWVESGSPLESSAAAEGLLSVGTESSIGALASLVEKGVVRNLDLEVEVPEPEDLSGLLLAASRGLLKQCGVTSEETERATSSIYEGLRLRQLPPQRRKRLVHDLEQCLGALPPGSDQRCTAVRALLRIGGSDSLRVAEGMRADPAVWAIVEREVLAAYEDS